MVRDNQPPKLGSHTRSKGVLKLTFLPALPNTVPVGEKITEQPSAVAGVNNRSVRALGSHTWVRDPAAGEATTGMLCTMAALTKEHREGQDNKAGGRELITKEGHPAGHRHRTRFLLTHVSSKKRAAEEGDR
jgi:hypothetical protein